MLATVICYPILPREERSRFKLSARRRKSTFFILKIFFLMTIRGGLLYFSVSFPNISCFLLKKNRSSHYSLAVYFLFSKAHWFLWVNIVSLLLSMLLSFFFFHIKSNYNNCNNKTIIETLSPAFCCCCCLYVKYESIWNFL